MDGLQGRDRTLQEESSGVTGHIEISDGQGLFAHFLEPGLRTRATHSR